MPGPGYTERSLKICSYIPARAPAQTKAKRIRTCFSIGVIIQESAHWRYPGQSQFTHLLQSGEI